MVTVSTEEMQRDATSYLKSVEEGETLIITRGGKFVAEVKSLEAQLQVKKPRPSALC